MRSDEYQRFIEGFVEEEESLIGDLAYQKADDVPGISVSDGALTFDKEPSRSMLLSLFKQYEAFQGDGAKGVVKRTAERTRIELSFLPDEITPVDPARKFWAVGAGVFGIMMGIVLFEMFPDLVSLHSGLGFMELASTGISFSQTSVIVATVVAFLVGMMMEFVPCSVPIWTLLLPEQGESFHRSHIVRKGAGFMLKSVLILGVFGALVGLVGDTMIGQLASVSSVQTGMMIGMVMMGAVSLLWGLQRLGFISLPDFDFTIGRRPGEAWINLRDIVAGVVYGGSELGCPIPFYHLLIIWIALSGSPVFGIYVMAVYTAGKYLPLIMIGVLMQGDSRRIFNKFRVGQPLVESLEAAMLIMVGMGISVMMLLLMLGGTPIIIFRLVQVFVMAGVAVASFRIYEWTKPIGWKLLAGTGLVAAGWSVFSLGAHALDGPITLVDGLGVPLLVLLLSLTATAFIARDMPITASRWVSLWSVVGFSIAIIGLVSWFAISQGLDGTDTLTVFYASTLLLGLPALYGFWRIYTVSDLDSWRYFFFGIVLLYVTVGLVLYGSIVCATGVAGCSGFPYGFGVLLAVPIVPAAAGLTQVAPLLMLLSLMMFGAGTLLFYHKMYEPVKQAISVEGNRLEQLIRGVFDEVGDIVGKPVTKRLITEAVDELEDVELRFDGDDPLITMGVSIDNDAKFNALVDQLSERFKEVIGPVGEQRIATVATNITQLDHEQSSDDITELVQEHTVDEVKEAVEDQDLDLASVLEAEIKHKNRKTLKAWLESHIRAESDEE